MPLMPPAVRPLLLETCIGRMAAGKVRGPEAVIPASLADVATTHPIPAARYWAAASPAAVTRKRAAPALHIGGVQVILADIDGRALPAREFAVGVACVGDDDPVGA